ncbi:MAG: EamA family transporter [Candidatus Solibacter usitatus]|nr:EamA family transporter [Candidatus Solibacter usitatus]
MPDNSGLKSYLALVFVCFFWGTTYLGIRIGLESFPPLMLISARFLISGSIMVAFGLARGTQFPRGRELRASALSGLLILGLGNGCLVFAETLIPSGLASLMITLSPFWLVGLEALLPGGVRLHAPTIFGMLIGCVGTALLVSPGLGSNSLNRNVLYGFLILQLGMASWSFGSIYLRRRHIRSHPIVVGAVQQLVTGLAVLPLALLFDTRPAVWNFRGIAALLYLVTFGSIVGYSAYTYALDRLPVAVLSIYPYVNSVVAVVLGWLFYREPFGARESIAMAIIFFGVALVKWHSRKASVPVMEVEA